MREGWAEVTLKQALEPIANRPNGKNYTLVLSVTEKRGIIPQTEIFKHRIATEDISKYKVIEPMDIAYNPYLLWCGAIGQWKGSEPGVVSPVYECFRVKNNCSPKFIGYIFESGILTEYFNSRAIGSIERRRRTIPEDFIGAPIMLPPLAEQKRIVDLISTVDSYIEALQQQVDNARKSRNAVLHELLTKGGEGWVEITIGDVIKHTIGGAWGGEPGSQEVEVHVVRSTEFTKKGYLNFKTGVTRSIKISQLKSRELKGGDILLEKSGGGPDQPVGRVVFVSTEIPDKTICSNFVQLIRPDNDQVNSFFLFLVLWRWHAINRTLEFQAQTTGIRNLRTSDYLEQSFKLPPLSEQKRIIDIISVFDEHLESLELSLTKTQNLRSALLSDLLSGNHQIPSTYDKLLGAA